MLLPFCWKEIERVAEIECSSATPDVLRQWLAPLLQCGRYRDFGPP